MGRRKRYGKHSPMKDKLIKDSEGNEESRNLVPDSNKTKTNYAKEHNEAHKNTKKEELLQVTSKNFMEMLLDMANENVKEALKKFQDSK
jgi:hypothetical protein